ncbi:MAG: DUF4294 domain-containing protein [Bacteroidota bacterium]
MRLLFTIFLIILYAVEATGQEDSLKHKNDTLPDRFYILPKVNRDGVIMPEVEIKEVTVVARPKISRRNENRVNERLVYNIKKVYPYALMVRMKLSEVNEDIKNITDEKERKKYFKNVEKDVFSEYEDDMREMTMTQGRLLIKLIDRETQNTSYELIRDYRGKFSAAFWQGIARIFGTNLKEEYDAYGDDSVIELIINEIEAGRL